MLTFCLLLLPLWDLVIVLCFVVRYFMSILVLHSPKIYDKQDNFNFEIVNFLFLDGDVPRSPSYGVQSKLFITSLVITEYSISNIKLLGTDLFPLKFPLYNRIFT